MSQFQKKENIARKKAAPRKKTKVKESRQTSVTRVEVPPVQAHPEQGLTMEQVRQRTEGGWANLPVDSPTKTEKQIIKENCVTFFNLIFLVLAVALALVGSFKNMMFLVIAVANTAIGIFQEIRSKRAVDALTLVAAQKVKTIREGQLREVPSDQLVRDDIVEFGPGDQICADGLVRLGELQVNESLITGEADAIVKRPGDPLKSGSFVITGRARAQLTQVGADSYASQLALEAKKNPHATQSGMMRSLTRLIQIVGLLLVPVGGLLFYQQYKVMESGIQLSVESTVAALVGMIPEGLYLLTSVAMAVSAMKLARKKVLVQDMNCIETLARVDVVCVDKTGTITEPKMEVADLIPLAEDTDPEYLEALLAAMYGQTPADNDTARAMAETYGQPSTWICTRRIPFTSATKWSGAVFQKQGAFVVGAPEFILGDRYAAIQEQVEPWSARGFRVLLVAQYGGDLENGKALNPEQVEPLAMTLLSNRIRDTAPETFRYFAENNVAVKVISGDNPVTVSEVARQAGIPGAEQYVDASTLGSDEAIAQAANTYTVFGRVTPENKRKLVAAMKAAKHTVAMTGDGVNDVLALKEADCGIAMASGAQAASQVAQLVLLESDFAAMPKVVGEGRRVINNIQRAAALFLVKNIFSLLLSLISLCAVFAYPMNPLHMSMISGVCIGIPSFFLALEPNYERVKGSFMKNVLRRAFPGGLSMLALVLLAVAYLETFSLDLNQIYTVSCSLATFVGIMVLFQVCKPFNRNRTILFTGVCLLAVVCFTLGRDILEFVRLDSGMTLVLVTLMMLAPSVFLAVEKIFDFAQKLPRMLKNLIQKMDRD